MVLTALPAIGAGDRFSDVSQDHVFVQEIEWLADQGITRGCNPPVNDRFCPEEVVTRGQMAAFLVRALPLPAAGSQGFVDTAGSVFAGDIDRLAAAGITKGCNPPANNRFCPDDVVTRGQMAAFLARALGLPVATSQGFIDTAGSVFAGDIDRLAAEGITRGCNPPTNNRFCPDQPVTRGAMAAFLYRALSTPVGFEIVSVSSEGIPGNSVSYAFDMSSDGRYVSFVSSADNLVSGDTNGLPDVFVRDRVAKTTERLNIAHNDEDLGLSGTGISDDGRYVVFESTDDDVVAGDTNGHADIYLHDRKTGATIRISDGPEGQANDLSQVPAISGDGRYVAFHTYASNLIGENGGVALYDQETGQLTDVGYGGSFVFSRGGRYTVSLKPGSELVRRDRITGAEERVDVSSGGVPGDGLSLGADISADGRFVLFQTSSTNLVASDTNEVTDLFLRDMTLQTTVRVSLGAGDTQLDAETYLGSVSDDGARVAFSTAATTAVSDDDNGEEDVFIRDVASKTTRRINVAPTGEEADGQGWVPLLTGDGRWVLFMNEADNLVPGGEGQLLLAPTG